jgi:hypothetical protein
VGDWTAFTERMLEELFDTMLPEGLSGNGARCRPDQERLTGPLAPSTPFDGCGGAAGEQFVLGALRSRLREGGGPMECRVSSGMIGDVKS